MDNAITEVTFPNRYRYISAITTNAIGWESEKRGNMKRVHTMRGIARDVANGDAVQRSGMIDPFGNCHAVRLSDVLPAILAAAVSHDKPMAEHAAPTPVRGLSYYAVGGKP